MDYLQLINDFIAETQMEDAVATVGTVFDDTEQAAIWTRDGWVEIQRARPWDFRWAEGSFVTVPGQLIYNTVQQNLTSGDEVNPATFRIRESGGRLSEVHYRTLRNSTGTGVPSQIALRPNASIHLSPTPDAAYTVDFEYYVAPVFLTEDSDTPSMPASFHKAIVWKALENYAREQGNEWRGLYETSIRNYNAIYSLMLNRFLPQMGRPVPLQR